MSARKITYRGIVYPWQCDHMCHMNVMWHAGKFDGAAGKVSFLRPASSQELTCRAEVLRTGRNLIFVEAEVMAQGVSGRVMVAKASSTLAVIPLNSKAGGDASQASNTGGSQKMSADSI